MTDAEPAEWTLARANASFDLAATPCESCGYMPRVNQWGPGVRVVVEPRHRPGCPAGLPA